MKPIVKIYTIRVILGIVAAFVCIGYIIAAEPIPRNLVSNPSVELGTTSPQDWLSTGNGTEWSTTYARTDARSIRINVTNSSAEWRSNATEVKGEQGVPFQVQAFFLGNVTKDYFFLSVRWFSDLQGLEFISENNISISVGSYLQWSLIGGTVDAPSQAKSFEIVFLAVNGSGNLYGDSFEIRQIEFTSLLSIKLMNSIMIALLVYLVSYYAIKSVFIGKVEKPQKIFTTGIGIYFFTWLVSLIVLYTLIVQQFLI
jgi:hypothetical protein